MRFIPRTLLARAFLLVSGVMVLSVVAWWRIYLEYEREPRARQLAQLVVSVVNLTRAALIAARPEVRPDLLRELSAREGLRIYPAEAGDSVAPLPETALFELATQQVKRELGERTRFANAVDGVEGLWVSFDIDEDEYWIVRPSERFARIVPKQWIGWGAAALLLSLVAAYLIAFRVTRPLKALSDAASAIGRGEHPEAQRAEGPHEVATVALAFNRMAEDLRRLDADRALILAGISHDLRTPLARLRLGIEMSGADESTRRDMSEDIEEMDRTIGQFLDFARDPGGEPSSRADLDAIVAETVEPYQRRGARVHFTPAGEAPSVVLRPQAMRRLVSNLIDNALRHAGALTTVEVRTGRHNGAALIEVSDRGPGIPVEQIERLKRPFSRLEEARGGTTGAGLGLAIVDRICRAHGGKFDLLPREGGGLIARVRIPD